MKKKNAFTLAELLAVITILGVIALIVFPAVNKTIKNSKEKSYNQQVESILESAENWTTENMSQLSDTSNNYITIGELQQSGYLEAKKVINPITDEEMNGCIVIKYDENYSQYTYQYNEISCDELKPEIYTFQEKMENSDDVMNNDPDGNLRYTGADPNNYVWFNKDSNGNPERWRIIGLFDGQAKVIRNDYYGTSIAWNSDGPNNWATASLQLMLNSTTDGYIKAIQTNDPTSYGYIDLNHVWNIGAYDDIYDNTGTRSAFYEAERSETPAGASGSEATWEGTIGLMYPSDYGYASSGSSETCNNTEMYGWGVEPALTECAENSWLFDSSYMNWTITPHSEGSALTFGVFLTGIVYNYRVERSDAVRPVLYLKSNTKIVGGQGTYNEPYLLGME